MTTTMLKKAKAQAFSSHIVINLSEVNSPTSTPIFKLDEDTLMTIFSMLGRTEPAPMLESNHFGPPGLTRVLLCVALVCKRWSSIANGLLFKRSEVCSHNALKQYNQVLRAAQKRGISIDFINSFTYYPPLMELGENRSSSSTKVTPQGKRQDNKDLREALTLLPSSTTLNLKASSAQLDYLTKQSWFRTANLVTLHIVNTNSTKEKLNMPFDLPNLHTLILQRFEINNGSTLPTVPNLQNLRLIQVNLTAPTDGSPSRDLALGPFVNLRRLELIETHYYEGELKPFLRKSSETLEYLSLINVGGPEFERLIYDLGFLQTLRGLCIGPYAFRQESTQARSRFPESLECLTVWQLLKPRLVLGAMLAGDNVAGLKHYLSYAKYHNPNLNTIRIRGADYELAPHRSALQQACETAGVALEMSTFKFYTYIKPDVPLRDRAWNAMASVPNYFLSFFRKDARS